MLDDPFAQEAVEQNINIIPMDFREEFKPDPQRPGEFKTVHRVDLVKKGTNGESTPWNVENLKKEEFIWPHVKPAYERWLAGQEEPVNGTPLGVLSFLPKGIIEHLKGINILTAEDLADMDDNSMNRLGMGARNWREKTRLFLESKADGALAAQNVELQRQLDEQAKEMETLRTQVNALAGMNTPQAGQTAPQPEIPMEVQTIAAEHAEEASNPLTTGKRKPGRPRKA